MNFAQAYKEMRSGKKITNVRFHGGYWVWENDTIMIHCADGTVLDIRDTPDTAYTFDFIVADEWSYITEKEKPKIIYVVSCYKNGETPIVTAYDNKDAAVEHYDAVLTFGRYDKVDMEECPIYESFSLDDLAQEEMRDYCGHWEPTYSPEDGNVRWKYVMKGD